MVRKERPMSNHPLENVEITNMCMVCDPQTGKVLVQNRTKKQYDGIAFPGGHTEPGEPLVPSVIREVQEETGLTIDNVVPCGFKDWYYPSTNKRYLVLMFKTSTFRGHLKPRSPEGDNQWLTIDEIKRSRTAEYFLDMLPIFLGEGTQTEMFFTDVENKPSTDWHQILY